MVLYDDKVWLSRLIRTAFVLEDESGICEKVLKKKLYLGENAGSDSDSISSTESFDIREASDVGHSRRRSNTAIRLERLEKQRKAQTEITHVRLHSGAGDINKTDLGFVRDEQFVNEQKQKNKNAISIKQLLQSVPHPSQVPFYQYSSLEASSNPTLPYKRTSIFLPFLPANKKAYPLRVAIVAQAKILDLIGLTLWLVSQNYPGQNIKPIEFYSLQIADDDGEYDNDFPNLDPREPVSKFSFAHLALVENKSAQSNQKLQFSFLLPDSQVFKINLSIDELDLTIGQVINLVITKSDWKKHILSQKESSGIKNHHSLITGYHFEKLGDSNTTYTDLNMPLSQCKCKDFCLVRDGSKSVQASNVPSGKHDLIRGEGNLPSGRSDLYPVIVSTGRFNKLKNALCVILGGDRMDLEFQNKTKSYPLSSITGVKFDSTKNRVIVSISQPASTTGVVSHYSKASTHITLTLMTTELRIATELYHHLNSICNGKLNL